MLLTSYKYALFVTAVFCVYYLVQRFTTRQAPQNAVLLLFSYVFYALWDLRWCLLLAAITATGFFGALVLERAARFRRTIVIVILLVNLGTLGAFKYFGFFSASFVSFSATLGFHVDQVTLHLVLPVGISYYVFQNLSYVIDVYRRDMVPTHGILEYATALSFFPQILAGPITRPRDLVPQLFHRRAFDEARARDGLRQVLWGLTKKMLIADNLGMGVDYVWSHLGSLDGIVLVMAAMLYSIQIYCDFSGYADIAIGTAKLFNLRLHRNFEYPYFSASVQAFWRRWHITLATWMRDYVYIPLGGSRCSAPRRDFNLLITFLLVGLWHGANWTYVIWGLLHGTYLIVGAHWRTRREHSNRTGWRMGSAVSTLFVFTLVTVAWIFFRAPSVNAALSYVHRLVVHSVGVHAYVSYVPMMLLSAAFLVYEWLTRHWEHGLSIGGLPLVARWVTYLALCMGLLLFGFLGGRQGIYVQF